MEPTFRAMCVSVQECLAGPGKSAGKIVMKTLLTEQEAQAANAAGLIAPVGELQFQCDWPCEYRVGSNYNVKLQMVDAPRIAIAPPGMRINNGKA